MLIVQLETFSVHCALFVNHKAKALAKQYQKAFSSNRWEHSSTQPNGSPVRCTPFDRVPLLLNEGQAYYDTKIDTVITVAELLTATPVLFTCTMLFIDCRVAAFATGQLNTQRGAFGLYKRIAKLEYKIIGYIVAATIKV